MKVKKIKIPIYDYDVKMIEVEKGDKPSKVTKECGSLTKADRKLISSNIKNEYIDGGVLYYNLSRRKFVIIVYMVTSKKNRIEIIGHEKRHVEDRLLNHCAVTDLEAAGYLSGWLAKKLI